MRQGNRVCRFLALFLLAATPAAAQQDTSVASAQAAYEALDYAGAIRTAGQALRGELTREERVTAYELLGFSYGALDSTRLAVQAFQRLIFLAPDREPDVERVSPRITSLYASALGQVLVVRRVSTDSVSFVAGTGAMPIRFEVSRLAQTSTRVIGPGVDFAVDSQTVAGPAQADWSLDGPDGRPIPPGQYQIIVTAREGERSEYASEPLTVRLEHGRLDTYRTSRTSQDTRSYPSWSRRRVTGARWRWPSFTRVWPAEFSSSWMTGTWGLVPAPRCCRSGAPPSRPGWR